MINTIQNLSIWAFIVPICLMLFFWFILWFYVWKDARDKRRMQKQETSTRIPFVADMMLELDYDDSEKFYQN
jgi:hypothetical protein